MELGPFKDKIEGFNVDITGLEYANVWELTIADLKEYELMQISLDDDDLDIKGPQGTDERASIGATVHVEWMLEIVSGETGIQTIQPSLTRAHGIVVIEDLPKDADPNDENADLINFDWEFDTEDGDWDLDVRVSKDRELTDEIYAEEVSLDIQKKLVIIEI
jgi:hypothetical protein